MRRNLEMNCEQAQQLFDAYLDGELSTSLATELGAHRLRCSECRRALALLEVTGHVLTSYDDRVSLKEGFEERLLACVDDRSSFRQRFRRTVYILGPLAAAAVITMAFLGAFDRTPGRVAGEKVQAKDSVELDRLWQEMEDAEDGQEVDPRAAELDRWGRKMQENLQSFQDLTIYQWLDVLEKAKDSSAPEDHYPGADPSGEPEPEDDLPIEDIVGGRR